MWCMAGINVTLLLLPTRKLSKKHQQVLHDEVDIAADLLTNCTTAPMTSDSDTLIEKHNGSELQS